jgi:hypothetical protein
MATEKHEHEEKDANRDPITDEPGAHPVGAGVGAAVGGAAAGAALGAAGAAAQGAVLGMAAGPVGAVVGAVAGGIVGGLVGKRIAEEINPTDEEAYWRDNYRGRHYVGKEDRYEDYAPAYRYGWESYGRHAGRSFDEAETDLRTGWGGAKTGSRLEWDRARPATRDAWDRIAARSGSDPLRPLPPKG